MKSRLKAHSKVVIAHEWLPHETVGSAVVCVYLVLTPTQSKVVTASWDGLIKLWVSTKDFDTRIELTADFKD